MKSARTILTEHLKGKIRAKATVNDAAKLIIEAMELYRNQPVDSEPNQVDVCKHENIKWAPFSTYLCIDCGAIFNNKPTPVVPNVAVENKWIDYKDTPKDAGEILVFTENESVYVAFYKPNRGYICYGIDKKELEDVKVIYWQPLPEPPIKTNLKQ